MLYHEIGLTAVLGNYDGVPSDRQIGSLLENPGTDAGRVRVPVRLRPDRGPEIHLPVTAAPAAAAGDLSQRTASSR
jgi:hypothetical protein